MATPKQTELTPKAAIKWLEELRKLSERRGGDASTKYAIHYMFKYIERVMQYQEPMPPEVDEETGDFKCPRCGVWQYSDVHTAYDYKFCSLCGQRWKEDEEDGEEDNIC